MPVSYSVVLMPGLIEKTITCPYCGENINLLVDGSVPEQSYVEDCQVCCRPMVVSVSADPDGDISVDARSENE